MVLSEPDWTGYRDLGTPLLTSVEFMPVNSAAFFSVIFYVTVYFNYCILNLLKMDISIVQLLNACLTCKPDIPTLSRIG